jgi:hypothetical protein
MADEETREQMGHDTDAEQHVEKEQAEKEKHPKPKKGYEQRSKREFGWHTQGEMDRNAPSLAALGATLRASPRLFGHRVEPG